MMIVITTIEMRLSQIPTLAISGIRRRWVPKIIALGGVATGSMKAHDAATVAGTISTRGFTPTTVLNEAMIGRTTCVVAVFDVNSVRNVIIAVTASVFEEDRASVMAIGCDDIVIKPFRVNAIVEMLQKHLGVKFSYAADEMPAEKIDLENGETVLSATAISELPAEIVERFKVSVESLDMDKVLNIIEEIRGHNQPLADVLQTLAEEYRFDKLQDFLSQV